VLTLRSAEDCRRLRPLLTSGARVVLIGGGFIGLEVAASASKLGCEVTVLEAAPRLLARALAPRVAGFMAETHRAAGVEIVTGAEVADIRHGAEASEVRLADGTSYPAEVVILGVGAALNDALAREAGLTCDDGVLVDSTCRAEAEGVYVIGDLARHENRRLGRRLRLESWENAELQAGIAAANLLGGDAVCDAVPWFWTDQHDVNLQLLGYGEDWDEEVLRARPEDGAFCAFYLRGGRMVMAALANAGRERRPAKQLIEAGAPVSADALTDESMKLRDLAKQLAK
jgi:3-phenylpropionate/trans-cinnamate dioxygenase ferredoxin reductase subunit